LLSFVDTTSKTEFINNILEKVKGIEKPHKLTKGKIPCHQNCLGCDPGYLMIYLGDGWSQEKSPTTVRL